jgi:hypothetical protein
LKFFYFNDKDTERIYSSDFDTIEGIGLITLKEDIGKVAWMPLTVERNHHSRLIKTKDRRAHTWASSCEQINHPLRSQLVVLRS